MAWPEKNKIKSTDSKTLKKVYVELKKKRERERENRIRRIRRTGGVEGAV